MAISEQLLRVDGWRTRFLAEGIEAIGPFLIEYPDADRKLLKALVQEACAMHRFGTPRKLLRYIRKLDEARGART